MTSIRLLCHCCLRNKFKRKEPEIMTTLNYVNFNRSLKLFEYLCANFENRIVQLRLMESF